MHNLSAPIVFIIFNRPDKTQQVFNEIAKVKPSKLLVISDGPRSDRLGEGQKVNRTRSIIEQIDWKCELFTNYSEVNLGCKNRVSSGIDWAFTLVDRAIFLEDDCVPDPSFFEYCDQLLCKYESDPNIGMISGDNFFNGRHNSSNSYYFSRYAHIWGWATWKDRWINCYDVNLNDWLEIRGGLHFKELIEDKAERTYWTNIFDRVHRGQIDTWDYQWFFANLIRNRLSIIPSVNLISNIGFDSAATHTVKSSDLANIPSYPIKFPLIHPSIIVRDMKSDEIIKKRHFKSSIFRKILHKLFC